MNETFMNTCRILLVVTSTILAADEMLEKSLEWKCERDNNVDDCFMLFIPDR